MQGPWTYKSLDKIVFLKKVLELEMTHVNMKEQVILDVQVWM